MKVFNQALLLAKQYKKPLAIAATTVAGAAMADGGVDVTSVTAAITLALTAIATVGAAILGLHVAVKAYKWVRAAMS